MESKSLNSLNLTELLENQPYVSRKNLELLLGSNRRTTDDRIKSLIKKNTLYRLKRGFYLSVLYYQKSTNKTQLLEYIGSILNYPSYISLEYALDSYNLIAESVTSITYITTKRTKKIKSELLNFSYKNIKDDLFKGFEARNYNSKNYFFANPAKALFDFFYYVPEMDNETLDKYIKSDSRINWEQLSSKDKSEFKELVENENSPKMNKVKTFLSKEGIL